MGTIEGSEGGEDARGLDRVPCHSELVGMGRQTWGGDESGLSSLNQRPEEPERGHAYYLLPSFPLLLLKFEGEMH